MAGGYGVLDKLPRPRTVEDIHAAMIRNEIELNLLVIEMIVRRQPLPAIVPLFRIVSGETMPEEGAKVLLGMGRVLGVDLASKASLTHMDIPTAPESGLFCVVDASVLAESAWIKERLPE